MFFLFNLYVYIEKSILSKYAHKKFTEMLSSKHSHSFFCGFFSKLNVNWKSLDLYERLGVPKSATEAEIKRRYHEIAKSYHPDVLTREEEKIEGQKIMSAVNEAYNVLKDTRRRQKYDNEKVSHDRPHLRQQKKARRRKKIFKEIVHLTFEESVFGCTRLVTLDTTRDCLNCQGLGVLDTSGASVCPNCQGEGYIMDSFNQIIVCETCLGLGVIQGLACKQCKGTGEVPNPNKVAFDIPPGVENGTVINFSTTHGTVQITCIVQGNNLFTRNGNDLHITVPISYKLAILGGNVRIPTLDGIINQRILPGTQPNNVERMPGGGIKPNGDLYIHYKIIIPRSLSRKDKKIVNNIDEEYMKTINDKWDSHLNAFVARNRSFKKM